MPVPKRFYAPDPPLEQRSRLRYKVCLYLQRLITAMIPCPQKNTWSYVPFSTLVLLIASLFLIYEFSLQVLPSILTETLMSQYHVNALLLGSAMACYFYSYAIMQLFTGLSLDRIGPKVTLTVAILMCVTGTWLLSHSQHIMWVALSRFLTGMGSATAYIGVMFLGRLYCPERYLYLVTAATGMLACTGALIGQGPLAYIVTQTGWHHTLYLLNMFGLSLAIASLLVVQRPKHYTPTTTTHAPSRIKTILINPQAWAIGLYALLNYAAAPTFAGLWGVTYMHERFDLSNAQAATAISLIWVGIATTSLLGGWLSELWRSRRKPLIICSGLGTILFLTLLYAPLTLTESHIVLFGIGCASGGQILTFNLIQDRNPTHTIGTAMGFNNLLLVLAGGIFQPLVSDLLQLGWNGHMIKDIPYYSVIDYQHAYTVMPICYLLSFFIAIYWIKETYHRT